MKPIRNHVNQSRHDEAHYPRYNPQNNHLELWKIELSSALLLETLLANGLLAVTVGTHLLASLVARDRCLIVAIIQHRVAVPDLVPASDLSRKGFQRLSTPISIGDGAVAPVALLLEPVENSAWLWSRPVNLGTRDDIVDGTWSFVDVDEDTRIIRFPVTGNRDSVGGLGLFPIRRDDDLGTSDIRLQRGLAYIQRLRLRGHQPGLRRYGSFGVVPSVPHEPGTLQAQDLRTGQYQCEALLGLESRYDGSPSHTEHVSRSVFVWCQDQAQFLDFGYDSYLRAMRNASFLHSYERGPSTIRHF